MNNKIMLVTNDPNDNLIKLFGLLSRELTYVPFPEFSESKVEQYLPDTIVVHTRAEDFLGSSVPGSLAIDPKFQGIPLLCVFPQDTDPAQVKECSRKGATQTIILPLVKDELLTKLKDIRRIKEIYDKISINITEDEQTGLYNILYFHRALTFYSARALKFNIPLTCIMIELDKYSEIVDQHGNEAVTILMKKHAEIIGMTKKFNDNAYRYGKEAFLILCMNADLELANEQAEVFRTKLGIRKIHYNEKEITSTVSIGVSLLEQTEDDIIDGVFADENAILRFITNANDFMCNAKENGGDQVVCQPSKIIN